MTTLEKLNRRTGLDWKVRTGQFPGLGAERVYVATLDDLDDLNQYFPYYLFKYLSYDQNMIVVPFKYINHFQEYLTTPFHLEDGVPVKAIFVVMKEFNSRHIDFEVDDHGLRGFFSSQLREVGYPEVFTNFPSVRRGYLYDDMLIDFAQYLIDIFPEEYPHDPLNRLVRTLNRRSSVKWTLTNNQVITSDVIGSNRYLLPINLNLNIDTGITTITNAEQVYQELWNNATLVKTQHRVIDNGFSEYINAYNLQELSEPPINEYGDLVYGAHISREQLLIEFPIGLVNMMQLEEKSFRFPYAALEYFVDYYTQALPLYYPTFRHIGPKMTQYLNAKFLEAGLRPAWQESPESEIDPSAAIEVTDEEKPRYERLIQLGELLVTPDGIVVNQDAALYRALWNQQIHEPLKRYRLELGLPTELASIVKEYYAKELTHPLQSRLHRQLKLRTNLSTLPGPLRELILEYDQPHLPESLFHKET